MWKDLIYDGAHQKIASRYLNKDGRIMDMVLNDSKLKAKSILNDIQRHSSNTIFEWNVVFSDEIKTKEYPIKHNLFQKRPSGNENEREPMNDEGREFVPGTSYDSQSRKLISIILGEYDTKRDLITLYVNAILRVSNDDQRKFDEIIDYVLVHEVFHAVHHYLLGNNMKPDKNNRCMSIVEESLASFVEYHYCRLRNYDWHCNELICAWNSFSYGDWPYAGARIFLNNYSKNSLPNEFQDVLDHSLLNWIFACGEIRGHDQVWDSYPANKL